MSRIKYIVLGLVLVLALFSGIAPKAKAYYAYENDPTYQARLQQIMNLLLQAQQMLTQLQADYGQTGSVLGSNTYYPTYQTNQTPEISNLSTYSGPVGTYVDINGQRLLGLYGSPTVWLESTYGTRTQLYPQTGYSNTYMRVQITGSNCQYQGTYCTGQVSTGNYNIYVEVNGMRSNAVMFNVTGSNYYDPYNYNNQNQYNCQYYGNCYNQYPYNNPPYINSNWSVTTPTSGQIYNYADTILIQWTSPGSTNVELRLKTTTGQDCKIDEVSATQTSYSFRPIGSSCYGTVTQNDPGPFFIEAVAKNTSGTYYDPYNLNTKKQSGLFTIIVPNNI